MKNYLFVGNGLNQCLKDSISWGNLLQEIANELDVDYDPKISFSMEFERIVDTYLAGDSNPSDEVYGEVKGLIVKKLKDCRLPRNAIHRKIRGLDIDGILTTNYDYLLEYVYNPDFKYKGPKNKYYFEKTSTQAKTVDFYHVHGMIDSIQSICLGYEHYMGIVERIRAEINTKEKNAKENMKIKRILFGESEPKNTWSELFYTSNIYIFGFGLSECEADIWWLLTHRAYLYYTNYCGLKKKIRNKIVYYATVKEKDNDDTDRLAYISRKKLLESYGVEVREVPVQKVGPLEYDYDSAYLEMLEDIQSRIDTSTRA